MLGRLWTMWSFICVTLLSTSPQTSFANSSFALTEGIDVDVSGQLESLPDVTGKLTLDEVRSSAYSSAFVAPKGKAPNFGFSKNSYWLRFKMDPKWVEREDRLALVFGYALIDDLRLYVPQADGTYKEFKGGRLYPFDNRPLKSHFLHFVLNASPELAQDYIYIRGQTSSSHQYPLQIYSLQNFLSKYQDDSLGSRLYMGAIAIMFLYNAIFFLMTFDLIYLVYVAFIAVSGSQVLSVQGFSYQYLWPQAVGFNHISVPFLMCTSVCLMSLFSIMSLAQLAKYKILYRTVQVHIVLGLLGCVGAFALPYSSSIKIAVFLTFSASISTLVAYGRLSWARFRPAYFFLMSLGTLLTASIVYSLKAVGVLPYNFFTENAPLIGSALQISMLTFGLADRFRELQAQHQKMQKQMIELQKDNIRKLDEQVAEKTADIRSILKTINQGIFTISGDDLTIDPEKSDALTLMFPDTALQKSDPIDAIFAKSRLTSDSIDQIKAGFTASLDSDALNFDLNAACFPKVFEMETATGQKKYFECDWSPILDQHENVKKILVAVRDTTEVRRLEEEARRKDQEMGTIMEILAIPSQKFAKAYHAISRLIQQVRETTNKGDQIAPRDWQQLYALLHTAKGNSRTFGLKQLAGMIHEVEEHVKELTDQRTEDLWQMLLSGLREIEAYLEYIARLAEEKLGRSLRESPLTLADEDWKKLIQSLGELEKLSPSQQVAGEVIDMRNRLLHLRYFDLQDVVGDMQQALRLAAEHLGKPFPQIVIQDKVGAYLKEDTSETLQSAFVHLLTNSLDHGIENPEKRVAAGKKAEGTITLEVRDYNDHSVEIRLSDDGAGLNLPVLQQLVAKKGLKDIDVTKASSLAESIFASGVSTHEKVSQLSGRGVGMDAVRALIQGMGGQIGIVFLSAQPSVDRFEPFCFQMIIPKEHFWISRASA